MENTNTLNKSIVNNWYSAKNALNEIEEKINHRLTYILVTLYSTFGFKLDTWYFECADEGTVGEMQINGNYIDEIIVESRSYKYGEAKINIVDKFGNDWGFSGDIPVRWLYEEFESEIKEGKAKYEAKELVRKETEKALTAKQKAKKDALLISAKSKLTKEELRALKGNL